MNNLIEMKVRVAHDSIDLPEYETNSSAGMDLRAYLPDGSISLDPKQRTLIGTGLFFEIPQGFEVQIRPRSGLALKHGVTVLNSPGTIDADYRGEIKVILINHGEEPFLIEHEMRIAQMVVSKYQQVQFKLVKELTSSERGSGGFGSTGTK
ncbi:MAG: dUTP diphosphatase [Alphaproteobacteria bacterium]|jgi:dUTP pyrophosphatase